MYSSSFDFNKKNLSKTSRFITREPYPECLIKFPKEGAKGNLLHDIKMRERIASNQEQDALIAVVLRKEFLSYDACLNTFLGLTPQSYPIPCLEMKKYDMDLAEFLKDKKDWLQKINSETHIILMKIIFKKVLEAVQYVISKGVCHRNLILENLLVDVKCRKTVLTDFSHSCEFDNQGYALASENVGCPENRAPELYAAKEKYNCIKAEIFSLGVILYNLIFKARPFNVADSKDPHYKELVKGSRFRQMEKREPFASVISLMKGMLDPNPETRMSFDEVLNHPWLNDLGTEDQEHHASFMFNNS
jgi:serine/threonine protein kinase